MPDRNQSRVNRRMFLRIAAGVGGVGFLALALNELPETPSQQAQNQVLPSTFPPEVARNIHVSGDAYVTGQRADLLEAREIKIQGQTPDVRPMGRYETNEVLAGVTPVIFAFLESSGPKGPNNRYDWDQATIDAVKSKLTNSLAFWEEKSNHNARFIIDSSVIIPITGGEPIDNLKEKQKLWFDQATRFLGGTPNPNYFEQLYDVANNLRKKYQGPERKPRDRADWGMVTFIVNGKDEKNFLPSYACENCPYQVIIFNEDVNGDVKDIERHEWGHSGALDEYASAGNTCTSESGFFRTQNQNNEIGGCLLKVASVMKGLESDQVDQYALAGMGLFDSTPGNNFNIDSAGTLNASGASVTAEGNKIHVKANVNIVPAVSPDGKRALNINVITNAWVRFSNGQTLPVQAQDGMFDEAAEDIDMVVDWPPGAQAVELVIEGKIGGQVAVVRQSLGRKPGEIAIYMPLMANSASTQSNPKPTNVAYPAP